MKKTKIVIVVLIGMAFISGCAVKRDVMGRSVCKPAALENKKITIDCDSLDLKAGFTKYFMNGDWGVFDGPVFKIAEYTFFDGSSAARANTNVSVNLAFGAKADSASSSEPSRKITTNGQYDLKTDLLLRIELVSSDIYIKMLNYQTQEILLSSSFPSDSYTFIYFSFILSLHSQDKIKDIVFESITKDSQTGDLSDITILSDGVKKKYKYDAKANNFVLNAGERGANFLK